MNRALKLKELVYSHKPTICLERAELMTRSFQETEGLPIILKRAKALEAILSNMSIYILPGELIVGNQAHAPRSAPIFPEFDVAWIEKELDHLSSRSALRPLG